MLECLEQIISIPDGCGNGEESLSGMSVLDLPGITIKQASNIASEKFVTGLNLLRDARRRAILSIQSDFIAFLHGNGYVANLLKSEWTTKDRLIDTVIPASNLGGFRGVIIKAKKKGCKVKKIHIPFVYLAADFTGQLTFRIEEGEDSYPFTYTSTAGEVAKVTVNFTATKDEVYILLPDSVDVYSVIPNCGCGTSSTTPKSNDFEARGYYNGTETKEQSFGIYADVQSKCAYENIICALATQGLMGEVLLYKTGVNIMDERMKTDRVNYFTTYGREEAARIKAEWGAEYVEKWNTLIQSIPNFIKTFDNCGCIDCGSYIAANI